MTAQKFSKSLEEARIWMDNYEESNKKYDIMIFKAKRGKYSIVKRIVNSYVTKAKKIDPDVIVMEDIDDNLVRSWLIGNKDKIVQMVNDSLMPSV